MNTKIKKIKKMEIGQIVEWVIVSGIVLLWNGYLIYKMKKDEIR